MGVDFCGAFLAGEKAPDTTALAFQLSMAPQATQRTACEQRRTQVDADVAGEHRDGAIEMIKDSLATAWAWGHLRIGNST